MGRSGLVGSTRRGRPRYLNARSVHTYVAVTAPSGEGGQLNEPRLKAPRPPHGHSPPSSRTGPRERCESLTSDRQLSSRLADVGNRAASSSGMRPNSPRSEPTLGVGRAQAVGGSPNDGQEPLSACPSGPPSSPLRARWTRRMTRRESEKPPEPEGSSGFSMDDEPAGQLGSAPDHAQMSVLPNLAGHACWIAGVPLGSSVCCT
jgi:hypothetical protein